MTPHPPRRDVTTTETISDKDVTVTKRTRDHDELGKHVHEETVDRVCPKGESHKVVVDVEGHGVVKHSEVEDRLDNSGEVVHAEESVTEDVDGVTKVVVHDSQVGDKHERQVVNSIETPDGDCEKKVVTIISTELTDGSHVEKETIEQTRETSDITTTIIDETITTSKEGVAHTTTTHEEFTAKVPKRRKIEAEAKEGEGEA